MPLSGSAISGIILVAMIAQGNVGSDTKNIADAVGNGLVLSVVGKPFTTIDTGPIAGGGAGLGIGLILLPGTISAAIFTQAAASFGGSGPALLGICDAIEQGVIQGMLTATLTSTHSPVFAGVGILTPGSIPVVGAEVGANVTQAGVSSGLLGIDFPGFANAAGNGISAAFLTAVGQVAIVGGGFPGSAGAGTGSGTIS